MDRTASVAVITRTKNRPLLLERAIKSVLGQSYADWMHVIVNDGGDAAVVDELIAEMRVAYRNRIRVVHNPSSVGMEAASNIGLKQSDSKWVTILDDDDSWHRDFLSKCVETLQNKRAASIRGVVTQAIKVTERIEDGRSGEIVRQLKQEKFNPELKSVRISALLGGNLFTNNSFLYERDVIQTIGPYREDLAVLGDWEFNIRFISRFDIEVLPLELSYFHHRRAIKKGAMANSLIAGTNDFEFFATKIRNDFLREDISQGKVGLGTLLNLNSDFKLIHSRVQEMSKRSVGGLLLDIWRRCKRRIVAS